MQSGAEGVGETIAGALPAAPGLTKRQREVLERLEQAYTVKQIGTDLGISRNAVYQHIERLRDKGLLHHDFTASGQPPRRAALRPGESAIRRGHPSPGPSGLDRLRGLDEAGVGAAASAAPEIEAAIASGDAIALAYQLGRVDVLGGEDMTRSLLEAALRRLGVLDPDADPAENL